MVQNISFWTITSTNKTEDVISHYNWAIVVVFVVVVMLYDDSIQISKNVIQTLLQTIASMTNAI